MSKRSCPFHDCRPQMKIHVTDKEVASGIAQNEIMRFVYDKTRNLLYQGARSCQALTPTAEFPSSIKTPTMDNGDSISTLPLQHSRQMTLNHHCQLLPSTLNLVDQPPLATPCSGCGIFQPSEMSSCAFCEQSICACCVLMCTKCQEPFCAGCTFNLYDSGERHVCRNCC